MNQINKKKKAKQIKNFAAKTNELRKFQFINITLSIAALFLMFVSFGYIYNTNMNSGAGGTEVSFNGFNLLFAAFSGNYKNPSFGDLAIPFNFYATNWVKALGILIFFPFFAILINVDINIYGLIKNKQGIALYSIILNGIIFGFFLAIFIVSLSMKDSNILPIYCSNNKACSIKSLAIIPSITGLIGLGIALFNYIKYREAKKDLLA